MPSQQRFEGPSLEDLLAQVREYFGADVNIVEANKLRKGGVGGFFARELYEVVVDVEDSTPGDAPRTLLDLVDEVDDGPVIRHPVGASGEPLASAATIQALLDKTDDSLLPDEPSPPTEGIAALLAQVQRERQRTTAPTQPDEATISTDGDAFATVLARIAHATEMPAAAPAPAVDDDAPFQSYADASRARRSATVHAPAAVTPEPTLPAAPATTGGRLSLSDGLSFAPAPVDSGPSAAPVLPADVDTILDLDHLQRLGLPLPMLVNPVRGEDRHRALIELAARFPVPESLPLRGDAVIALVGDRAGMECTVHWVQEQLGLSPDMLMLATRGESRVFPRSRRITGLESAVAHREMWRDRHEPVMVVIDQPVGLQGTTWARHILDVLAPAAVWGVVDAQRKPEDVVEWSHRIGGIDAVSLTGTENTSSPASILTTGLPVSLIDGRQATPARWATVLDERLLAA